MRERAGECNPGQVLVPCGHGNYVAAEYATSIPIGVETRQPPVQIDGGTVPAPHRPKAT